MYIVAYSRDRSDTMVLVHHTSRDLEPINDFVDVLKMNTLVFGCLCPPGEC